jgi:hypothetical protein
VIAGHSIPESIFGKGDAEEADEHLEKFGLYIVIVSHAIVPSG